MAKQVLKVDYDYDFLLIGIACHDKDYKLTWGINKTMGWDLRKINDYELTFKGKAGTVAFSQFTMVNALMYREYFLLQNYSDSLCLLPELKVLDYFLIVKGDLAEGEVDDILGKLKSIPNVLTAYMVDVLNLKDKDNLLF